MEVLDTNDNEYTALRDEHIRNSEGCLLIYSINKRASFDGIRRFHSQATRVITSRFFPAYPHPHKSPETATPFYPMVIVGNECHREDEREVSTQEGLALATELRCGFVETSIKHLFNVDKPFYDIAQALYEHWVQTQIEAKRIAAKNAMGRRRKRNDKEEVPPPTTVRTFRPWT